MPGLLYMLACQETITLKGLSLRDASRTAIESSQAPRPGPGCSPGSAGIPAGMLFSGRAAEAKQAPEFAPERELRNHLPKPEVGVGYGPAPGRFEPFPFGILRLFRISSFGR